MILQLLFAIASSALASPATAQDYCGNQYTAQKVVDNQPYVTNFTHIDQTFDLYIPNGAPKPYKTIVLIHGGCFQGGDKADDFIEMPMATKNQVIKFVKAGYAVASLNYRKARPDPLNPAKSLNTYPTALDDVRDAWCYLQTHGREKYDIDSSRMVAMGHSAGSTLAALIGSNHTAGDKHSASCKPKVAGVIAMSGRSIFTINTEAKPPEHQDGLDCGEGFAGEKRNNENPQQIFKDMDIISHIDARTVPPFHLTHGTTDDLVDIQNSKKLCAALKEKCDFHPIAGGNHMYDNPGNFDEAFASNCKFLSTKIFGTSRVQTAVVPQSPVK